MDDSFNICSLDYLTGTIATGYKGTITALVMKDFCMSERGGTVNFEGTIIPMPAGKYFICLIQGGTEITRDEITDGYFHLRAAPAVIEDARNLQLDVVQNGRHIGTFLLKKEEMGGLYVSALEISADLQGTNFKILGESVREQEGLRKKAESLISAIFSTKKNWGPLSEDINSFSKNLFWYIRDAFYVWHRLLSRFLFRACEYAGEGSKERALSNALSFIELPLENETENARLATVVDTWLAEACSARTNLFSRPRQVLRVISLINVKLPGSDLVPLVKILLSSIATEARSAPVIREETIAALKSRLDEKSVLQLEEFSEGSREVLIEKIGNAEDLLNKGALLPEIIGIIHSLDVGVLDRMGMTRAFFTVLNEGAEKIDDGTLATAIGELESLSRLRDVRGPAIISFKELMKRLLSLKRNVACAGLLVTLGRTGMQDDIVFNRDVAGLILKSGGPDLIETYKNILKKIKVPPPGIAGFSDETWAELTNPLHLKRLSGFLTVVGLEPVKLRDVLVHLICNLHVSGVFIPDDRLFQREVSAYLNSVDTGKDFLLHHMLLKRLPVYFNEVGASGRIRELSTEIDSWGNDPVIYFLRKQVHANASTNNIPIIEAVISAWVRGDADVLKGRVPEEVRINLNPELLKSYSSALRPLFEELGIFDGRDIDFHKILSISDETFEMHLQTAQFSEEIRGKIILVCRLYGEILKKYSLSGIAHAEHPATGFSDMLERLNKLKEIFTSPQKTEPQESLFFKRHIAFGIPSVMGYYHEPKFDALADAFRLEERVRLLFEEMIVEIGAKGGSLNADALQERLMGLGGIDRFFRYQDLGNAVVSEVVAIIKTNRLHLSQVIDLLRLWQKELTWMVELLYRTFHGPLMEILATCGPEDLPPFLKSIGVHDENFVNKASDVIMRDMISNVTGTEELDRLLNSLIKALLSAVRNGEDIEAGPAEYEEEKREWFSLHDLSSGDAARLAPFIGSKAKNLVVLKELGLTVPHGSIFSSAMTKTYEDYSGSEDFMQSLREAVRVIETRTGCRFGGRHNPLFLSVRSGSYISMPGMLSTILYCGINSETLEGFIGASGDEWLAWDSYRRFVEQYAAVVFEAEPDLFEALKDEVLNHCHVNEIRDLDAGGIKKIVSGYLGILSGKGHKIPSDVFEQLSQSIKAVYKSWYGERAVQFREAMNVSDHWGTSVTLMQMIYGNKRGAGAAVFFTRKPQGLEKGIYGEIRESATGDDIVYGRMINRPLAREQSDRGDSLEENDPALFNLYREVSDKIEAAMGGIPQEVESVYVTGDGKRAIYILQTRRMEFHRGLTKKFHEICKMESNVIGRGVGMNGGALSGVAAFAAAPGRVRRLRDDTKQPIILLRKETSTQDVSVMPEIDGIVTSVGGATSHAAILSQKFDLTAVVGCPDMAIMTDEDGTPYAVIGNYEVREGTFLSIDGSTGLVYSGACMFTVNERGY
ncbi:MAG: hypothetical protein C4560_14585 [Nitrospiraceae bacterium]|nr:MAG: hypothetical protein C4560_14585 [Nitrospiraceae bacterium]